jgi:hypothetical protein
MSIEDAHNAIDISRCIDTPPKHESAIPGSSAGLYNSANQNRCGEFLCNAIICVDTRGKKSATIQPGSSSSSVSQCDMVLCHIISLLYLFHCFAEGYPNN